MAIKKQPEKTEPILKRLQKAGCTCNNTFVLIGALLICLVIDGCSLNIGIFISFWLSDFGVTRFHLDWIGSLQLFATYCLGPFTGALIRTFGIGNISLLGGFIACLGHLLTGLLNNVLSLYLCFGFLSGCGYGMLYMSAIVAVTTGFDELRPIAMGIMACGSGIGASIMSLLIPQLEQAYCWEGACILVASALLNCCVFGAMLNLNAADKAIQVEAPRRDSSLPDNLGFLGSGLLQLPAELGGTDFSYQSQSDLKQALVTPKMQNMMGSLGSFSYLVEVEKLVQDNGLFGKGKSLWKNRSFLIYLFAVFAHSLGCLSPLILLFDKLIYFKIPQQTAAKILSLCGISNACSRLTFGTIANMQSVTKRILMGSVMLACGSVHLSSYFSHSVGYLYIYSTLVGICLGAVTVLHPLVLAELVQVERLTEAMGFEIMAIGIGYCLGTPMATFINIYCESVHTSYMVSAVLLAVSGTLILVIHFSDDRFTENDIERLRRRLEAAIG